MSESALRVILETRLIAVVRTRSVESLPAALEALRRGGVRAIEITLTTPGALEIVARLAAQKAPGDVVGAGTVLDAGSAGRAISAGADFVVSPVLDRELIRTCRDRGVMVSAGGLTPTEILAAWRSGADIVKVFPATAGPKYFKDLKGPFPDIRIMPTGGVSPENAAEFIRVGACAVALGTALLDSDMIRSADWDGIAARASKLVESLREA
jgi:2-dehydro-3-deoxyphosphogluconate aldolase / (4S)-4-hydroxy-2-oxoglutarate aldolase